jgi:hypothetical protein
MATKRRMDNQTRHAMLAAGVDPDTGNLLADRFDVTCVIGSVVISDQNVETTVTTPYEAAMLLIARHDAPGQYNFPMPSGGVTRITVEYFDNPDMTYDPYGPGARNEVRQPTFGQEHA